MTTATLQIICRHCDAANKLPAVRLSENPSCGKCHQKLFAGKPVAPNDRNYCRCLDRNDIPVVVDFWMPWCGPCLQMAPAFEAAVAENAPPQTGYRLGR